MTQLEPHCPDCGRPVATDTLCSACEQDREMEVAQIDGTDAARVIYGEV